MSSKKLCTHEVKHFTRKNISQLAALNASLVTLKMVESETPR